MKPKKFKEHDTSGWNDYTVSLNRLKGKAPMFLVKKTRHKRIESNNIMKDMLFREEKPKVKGN